MLWQPASNVLFHKMDLPLFDQLSNRHAFPHAQLAEPDLGPVKFAKVTTTLSQTPLPALKTRTESKQPDRPDPSLCPVMSNRPRATGHFISRQDPRYVHVHGAMLDEFRSGVTASPERRVHCTRLLTAWTTTQRLPVKLATRSSGGSPDGYLGNQSRMNACGTGLVIALREDARGLDAFSSF